MIAMQERRRRADTVGMRLLLAMALLPGLRGSESARGGVVETRDGRRLEGTVKLEGGQVLVRPAVGPEVKLDLSAVRAATFRDVAQGTAGSANPPPQNKPPEKNPPKRVEGLRGEYFAGYELKDSRLVRIDPKIEMWWPLDGAPDPSVPKDFSVRWTGQIEGKYSETYTFHAGFDSGGRLWIGGRLLVDHWKEAGTFSAKIDLEAGRKYDLKMEVRKGQWGGNARLYWASKRQGQEVVPPGCLYPPAGTNPPTVQITTPGSGAVSMAGSGVSMEASASDSDGSVRSVEFVADGVVVGKAERSPWRIEWREPKAGYRKVWAKATDNAGISTVSEATFVAIVANARGELPVPWMEMPVGKLEAAAAVEHSNGTYTLRSLAGDLLGENEGFHYVFQALNGDGMIVARVAKLEAVHGSDATAGVLIRENLGPERAKFAFFGLASDTGLVFVRRENTWEECKRAEEAGSAPCFLKLTRHEKRISAYLSGDGQKWELFGQRMIDMPQNVFIGLAVANPVNELGRAIFDQAAITTGSPRMESKVKGVVLRSGTVVAGDIHSVDDTSVKMWTQRGELVIPTSQAARILIKPLTREAIERVRGGRSGVILNNGDFIDGSVSFKDGQIRVSSVLFGVRKLNTWDETIAAILRDIEQEPCRYEVISSDGSVLRGNLVEAEKDRLRITDPSGTRFTVNGGDLVQINCR